MGNDITINKYALKEYSKIEEEKASVNMLEDLNYKLQEIEVTNRLLQQNKDVAVNLLEDLNTLNKHVEKESAKSRAILGNMNNGLYVIGMDERIVLFNPAAEKMFGWSQDEVLGKKDSEIFSVVRFANSKEPDKHGLPYLIHAAWKSGKNFNLSFLVLLRKNGEEVVVSISVAPIFDDNKNVTAGVVSIQDMRHEFEVDRAKTEFLSVASHQLRTPLAAIKWFVELIVEGDLEEKKLNEEQKDLLAQTSESVERMIDLVNSLLSVSRIETGRIIISPQSTDLLELAKKVIKEIAPIFLKRKQDFQLLDSKTELPKINIDPKLIFEVIINLLSNSSKYTPEKGSITLKIEKSGDEILFTISDTGYGIPIAQQHRLFEKFFRAENVIKKESEGTGLGLFIVKAVVESSGGRIWFKSEENKGTIFYFTLPIAGSLPKRGDKNIELTKRFI